MHFRVVVANVPFCAAIGNRPKAERGRKVIWFLELERQKKNISHNLSARSSHLNGRTLSPQEVVLILFYYQVENIIENILYFTVFKHKHLLLVPKNQEVNLSNMVFLSTVD